MDDAIYSLALFTAISFVISVKNVGKNRVNIC